MGAAPFSAPTLNRHETADVTVVGSGIAGMSTAYELAKRGKSVVVLDRGPIGGGMTCRTTAHIASALDDTYAKLIRLLGEDEARVCADSLTAAIDRIEAIQTEEGIACDFARVDGFLFRAMGDEADTIEAELDACRKLGVSVERRNETPQIQRGPCLYFPRQARIDPMKYLYGLANCILRSGGRFYADTIVTGVDEEGGEVCVRTADGHTVKCEAAVVATNSPIVDRFAIHTKQAPYRAYALAAQAPRGAILDALYWDTEDPYHYIRLQPGADFDYLIVGGEDHKTGEANDAEARFEKLERWAREHFPAIGPITHRWSGQVLEPVDGLAFIGRNSGNEQVYVVSGDSGQGISNGIIAGILIRDLILNGSSPWAELYAPNRKTPGGVAKFISENLTAVASMAEYLKPGEVESVDALKPGQGAIVRQGLSRLAAYRDERGVLTVRSAACTHMGCVLRWNGFEQVWDCPCHGSHFAPDGTVLNAPAVSALSEVEQAQPRKRAAKRAPTRKRASGRARKRA